MSEGAYNRLASRYDELLEVAERNMLALRLKNAEQEIEILKLRAQLAKTQGRG